MAPVNPVVWVLLAAFNGRRWLAEQVDSILAQQGVQVRLLASVDASQDGSQQWFAERAAQDTRIELLPEASIGSASGNFFRLIRAAQQPGDYYCLADQDDIWQADKLIRAIGQLERHQAQGYSSNVISFWPDGRRQLIVKSQPQRRCDYLLEAPGPGCTFVLSATLFTRLRGFIQAHEKAVARLYYHDWFIYAYARASGFTWWIDAAAPILYRQHQANQQGANVGWRPKLKRINDVLRGLWFEQVYRTAALLAGDDAQAAKLLALLRQRRWGLVKLAFVSGNYRRKPSERIWLALSCVVLAIVGFTPPEDNL